MIMCHMMSHSHDELMEMAKAIRLDTKWLQKPGSIYEHFDVSLTMKKRAMSLGAVEIGRRDVGLLLKWKRFPDKVLPPIIEG